MKKLFEILNTLMEGAIGSIIGAYIHQFLKLDKTKWLEEHPIAKYKIDLIFYKFNVYIYYPFFSLIFPIYGIMYALLAPDYNTFPRLTVAWTFFALGITFTSLFNYLKKEYKRP